MGTSSFSAPPEPGPDIGVVRSLAISYVPATVDPMPGHFGFAAFPSVDAAEAPCAYRLGISRRNGVMRTRKIPPRTNNRQS